MKYRRLFYLVTASVLGIMLTAVFIAQAAGTADSYLFLPLVMRNYDPDNPPPPPKEPVTINFSTDIIFKGISVYGVIGRRMYDTWLQMQTFLSSGLFDPMPAVTHTFPLEDIDKALDAIHSGNAGKVILEIGSK